MWWDEDEQAGSARSGARRSPRARAEAYGCEGAPTDRTARCRAARTAEGPNAAASESPSRRAP